MDVYPAALRAARRRALMEVKDWVGVTWRRMVVLWDFRRRSQDCGVGGGSVDRSSAWGFVRWRWEGCGLVADHFEFLFTS